MTQSSYFLAFYGQKPCLGRSFVYTTKAMNTKLGSLLRTGLISALAVATLIPSIGQAKTKKVVAKKKKQAYYHITVSAIPGKDEHDFTNPTSRCLTASMKSLDASAVSQMNADIAKYGAGHAAPVATYKMNLDILWSAMEQPYCGYGAYGMTAVSKSFEKSVERTRANFLAATK